MPDPNQSSFSATLDELGNHCFGCGPDNPQGLHLQFVVAAADLDAITASTTVHLTRLHEGPHGFIHGGIIATLMDEVMSKLNRGLQVIAMTRHLEVDYLRPAPLLTDLSVTGRHLRRDGRKLFHSAELTGPDGSLLARAQGVFIVIDPATLAKTQAQERRA